MSGIRKPWAAAAVLGLAALVTGAGVALSTADDPKAPDLTDLRDAVAAASRRGANLDEVQKALTALETALGKGLVAGKEPRAELTALRNAVEAAAKKGENVEQVRKELEAVETKILGKPLARPKPAPPPEVVPEVPPGRLPPRPGFEPNFQPPPFPAPLRGGNLDPEAMQKAQELMRKALEMQLGGGANEAEARKLMDEARALMMKAMGGRDLGLRLEEFPFPDLGGLDVPPARENKPRLGVRMDRVNELTAEHLGIAAGRGIALTEVLPGSAAEKAGLKVHDIVLEFAGKVVTDAPEDFARLVNEAEAGKKLTAVVIRKGQKVEVTGIELADPAKPEGPRGGMKRLPVPPVPVPPDPQGRRGGDEFRGNMSVTVSNGEFTLRAEQDGVTYALAGKTENGKATLTDATITDGGKETKAASLEKVPEPYRANVERLLKGVGGRARVRD